MSDGAHQGVRADRALETILGGEEQPTESEKETPAEMLTAIRGASLDPESYGDAALAAAKIILNAYEKYPALRNHPTDTQYLDGPDGKGVMVDGRYIVLTPGLYNVMKKLHPDENSTERQVFSGLTGFMWGWAVNAVGYALGKPPVANPALMTIRTKESKS